MRWLSWLEFLTVDQEITGSNPVRTALALNIECQNNEHLLNKLTMTVKQKIELIDILSEIILINSETQIGVRQPFSRNTIELAERALQHLLQDIIVN